MKNLLLTIAVFSVLFFIIGCGESSITDPLESKGTAEVQKGDDPQVNRGTITLDGMLVDPSVPFTSYLQIRGGIDYVHEMIFVDPIPPAPQSYVQLHLSINAELSDPYSPQDPIWPITGESTDVVNVFEEGIYLLDKSFSLRDRSDGLTLVCRFKVTSDFVLLDEMWLAFQSDAFNKSSDSDPFTMPPVEINKPISH